MTLHKGLPHTIKLGLSGAVRLVTSLIAAYASAHQNADGVSQSGDTVGVIRQEIFGPAHETAFKTAISMLQGWARPSHTIAVGFDEFERE